MKLLRKEVEQKSADFVLEEEQIVFSIFNDISDDDEKREVRTDVPVESVDLISEEDLVWLSILGDVLDKKEIDKEVQKEVAPYKEEVEVKSDDEVVITFASEELLPFAKEDLSEETSENSISFSMEDLLRAQQERIEFLMKRGKESSVNSTSEDDDEYGWQGQNLEKEVKSLVKRSQSLVKGSELEGC